MFSVGVNCWLFRNYIYTLSVCFYDGDDDPTAIKQTNKQTGKAVWFLHDSVTSYNHVYLNNAVLHAIVVVFFHFVFWGGGERCPTRWPKSPIGVQLGCDLIAVKTIIYSIFTLIKPFSARHEVSPLIYVDLSFNLSPVHIWILLCWV